VLQEPRAHCTIEKVDEGRVPPLDESLQVRLDLLLRDGAVAAPFGLLRAEGAPAPPAAPGGAVGEDRTGRKVVP